MLNRLVVGTVVCPWGLSDKTLPSIPGWSGHYASSAKGGCADDNAVVDGGAFFGDDYSVSHIGGGVGS